MNLTKISFTKIYSSFFLILTGLIGAGLLAPFTAPGLPVPGLLLGGAIPTLVFLSFYLTAGKQRVIPAVLITTAILSWIYLAGPQKAGEFIGDYLNSFGAGAVSKPPAIMIINVSLSGAALLPFLLVASRSFRLRLIAAAGLLVYLLLGVFVGRHDEKVIVCLGVLFILFALTEFLQKAGIREKIVVYILPFLTLYFVVLLFAPIKAEPYDWQFVKTLYGNIRKTVILVSQRIGDLVGEGGDGFGLKVTGFSGVANVGGSVSRRDREVMQISLSKGKRMNVYLTGNIFDTFNGDNWTAEMAETQHDHYLDLVEIIYAVNRYDGENFGDYLHVGEMSAAYTELRTQYLFTPLKVSEIRSSSRWQDDLREYGGQWSFPDRKGYGTDYELSFYQMNLGQEFFREMIVAEMDYAYQDELSAESYDNVLPRFEISALTGQTLRERSESIFRQYTKPYPLSDEVRKFLAEVTRDAENGYEKCRALEQVLSGGAGIAFSYTGTPEELPPGKTFPDYFLLESRSGYCTYYATVFVLLARELGLPARYVQGFCVTDEQLGLEAVNVSDSMAHAWPEVYFQGVGWIPFEPTPGYDNGRYRYWNPSGSPAPAGNAYYGRPSQPEELFIGEDGTDEWVEAFDESFDPRWATLVLVMAAALIIAGAVLIIVDKLVKWRRHRRISRGERFIEQVRLNMQILALIGYRLKSGETVAEFVRRVGNAQSALSFRFAGPLQLLLYRGDDVSEEALALVQADREELYRMIRQASKWRYYWIRFRILVAPGGG